MSYNFYYNLLIFLVKSLNNNYTDNFDFYRFGKPSSKKVKVSVKEYFKEKFKSKKIESNFDFNKLSEKIDAVLGKYTKEFEFLYNKLSDKYSKEMLITIIAFRILGNKYVKFSLNTPGYWNKIEEIDKIADKQKILDPHFYHFILHYFDLNKLNIPIKFYYSAYGIMIKFFTEQYNYKNSPTVAAELGDIVIDAGACWGDSALYFANIVGKEGKVYGFEFVKENIEIFNINIQLNEHLIPIIKLIEKPLWSKSGIPLDISGSGPGSFVSIKNESSLIYSSISIDDFVESNNLKKIDFIKMDIEGAEYEALIGAEKTIRKYKPKLAISLYHSLNDFAKIPKWIDDLNLGYNLYMDHYTIHTDETVLYAKV